MGKAARKNRATRAQARSSGVRNNAQRSAYQREVQTRVFDLMDRALRSTKASAPRKHHVVPATYLQAWEIDGQLRVTDLETGEVHKSAATGALRRGDYYSLANEAIDPAELPPLLVETLFADIESQAADILRSLRNAGSNALSANERIQLSIFMGMQMARGEAFREVANHSADHLVRMHFEGIEPEFFESGVQALDPKEREDEAIRLEQLVESVRRGDVKIRPQKAQLVSLAAQAGLQVAEQLVLRFWAVVNTPKVLLTCDEPVVAIGGPGWPRSEKAGAATAAVVAFPLSPSRVLLMFRDPPAPRARLPLDHVEVAELNREVMANAARYVIDQPTRRTASRISVPEKPAAATAWQEVTPRPQGQGSQIVRSFRPSRWANEPHAPWPVARWY